MNLKSTSLTFADRQLYESTVTMNVNLLRDSPMVRAAQSHYEVNED